MIIEYHRPHTLEVALQLLSRANPTTYPLGGGTELSRQTGQDFAVVDLQGLRLNTIEKIESQLVLGATVTLQELIDQSDIPENVKQIARLEAGYNLRHMRTIAGSLISADGRSGLLAAFLALDGRLTWQPGEEEIGIGEWLLFRESLNKRRLLITKISISANTILISEFVRRTAADTSILGLVVARWPSGRTRVVVVGPMKSPVLAMDGIGVSGIEKAVNVAHSHNIPKDKADTIYLESCYSGLSRRLLERLEREL